MKALAFLLVMASFPVCASAQQIRLEKTTDKYGLKLKKENSQTSSLQSQALRSKLQEFQLREKQNPIFKDRQVIPRTRANGWYVIPNMSSIARIPNALPYFEVPEVAAIPNPLLRSKKGMIRPTPLN